MMAVGQVFQRSQELLQCWCLPATKNLLLSGAQMDERPSEELPEPLLLQSDVAEAVSEELAEARI